MKHPMQVESSDQVELETHRGWRWLGVSLMFGTLLTLAQLAAAQEPMPMEIPESSYQWWRDARFGIFIHWNASSVLHLGEGSWSRKNPTDQGHDYHKKGLNRMEKTPPAVITDGSYKKWMSKGGVPMEVYDNLYHVFNPSQFDADEWVRTFKEAGAGYIVFTTKHHDGFCMFDSQFTDYKITSTPFKRDVCKELADACHRHGLKVIWYYSKCDWFDPRHDVNNPGPYAQYLTNQVQELLTNYGPAVAGIWWDQGQIAIPTRPLFDMILKLRPGAISNGRISSPKYHVPGVSFGTPEQELGAFNMKSPWESCVTMQGEGWFWNGGTDIRSADSCLRLLINCAMGDGNLALDFGPDELGRIHPTIKKNYLSMGQWLKQHGQSIYGTRGGPYMPDHWGGSTRKSNTVYLHITQAWSGRTLRLPPLPRKILASRLLTGGEAKLTQTDAGITVEIDPAHHQPVDTVVALDLDGSAMDLQPIPGHAGHWDSLTVDATATASSAAKSWAGMPPDCVVLHSWEKGAPKSLQASAAAPSKELENQLDKPRGHLWRFWMAKETDLQPWIELDFGKPRTFDRLYLREKFNRIRSYQVQIKTNGQWQTVHQGKGLDVLSLALAKPVTVQKVRLLITEYVKDGEGALRGPGVQEIDAYLSK